ncbi:MAG TPA: hypothetical protein VH370_14840 [Humisphaera sp.]|jgi:hypothetical protein|nr:hypothetical protein [Humisphaera sp.]
MNDPTTNESLSPDERQFERSLSRLPAARLRFDDRQIWAIATARAEHRRVLFWRGVSGALAASLALALWARFPRQPLAPSPIPTGGIVLHTAPTTHDTDVNPVFVSWPVRSDINATTDDPTYLQVRQRVLTRGLNGVSPTNHQSAAAGELITPIRAHNSDRAEQNTVNYLMDLLGKGSQL